jgi:hypothetical protein
MQFTAFACCASRAAGETQHVSGLEIPNRLSQTPRADKIRRWFFVTPYKINDNVSYVRH